MAVAHNTDQHVAVKKIRPGLLAVLALILAAPIFALLYVLVCQHRSKDLQGIILAVMIVLMIAGLMIVWRLFDRLFEVLVRKETEKRDLELILIQSLKMEAIGELTGGISHDFNNILAAILCYTELAMLEEGVQGRLRRNLEQVQKACERARDLVNHILAFSRRHDQKLEPVQMGAVVKEGLKMLRASIPASIQIRQQMN